MEEPRIPKTEEGEAEPQRDQEHAHRVFQHLRDCAPWICPPKARPWTPSSAAMFFAVWGRTFGEKRPKLWRAGNWLLHDDNAPSHLALVTREFHIIIIFINCYWVITRWQCLLYVSTNMKMVRTNMKMVNTKFKTGGLHEKHVVATWNLGKHLSICL